MVCFRVCASVVVIVNVGQEQNVVEFHRLKYIIDRKGELFNLTLNLVRMVGRCEWCTHHVISLSAAAFRSVGPQAIKILTIVCA